MINNSQLIEQLKTCPYISPDVKVITYTEPYNHVIIENLLNEEIYEKMCKKFPEYISRVEKSPIKIGDTDLTYDARIYSLIDQDCNDGYDFFVSELWKDFVSNIFEIELNQHITYSLHHHTAPSRSGHVHADLSICSVIQDDSKKIKLSGDCLYNDDTEDLQPHTQKTMRTIASLYYFNNKVDNWQESDGGGTGMYANYNFDSFIKQVPPKNNSLFMFQIGADSYHGFMAANFDRSSMVQWFHSDIPSFLERNQKELTEKRLNQYLPLFERWRPKEKLWNYMRNTNSV